jgi:DNA-binding NarL/FixJ family response regulator
MRETLSDLIKREPGFAVCGAAPTGEEALEQLATVAADLVLVDLALPGMNGIDLIQALQVRQPDLPCLILSGHSEVPYIRQALEVGARGYVLKGNPPEILEAIQAVGNGGIYLSAAIQAKLAGGG